eukprot:363437-Chlamydomonas_euryale.AAC.5
MHMPTAHRPFGPCKLLAAGTVSPKLASGSGHAESNISVGEAAQWPMQGGQHVQGAECMGDCPPQGHRTRRGSPDGRARWHSNNRRHAAQNR